MLGYRKLDVYQCACKALPLAHKLAERGDVDTKRQLRRAALSMSTPNGSSALECAAVVDALQKLGLVTAEETVPFEELIVRVVSMLTRMMQPVR